MGILQPFLNESPVDYAHRLGQWYWSWNNPDKSLGQYFTSPAIARFMAQKLPQQQERLRLLDPGAGLGILACAVCETQSCDIDLEVYEIDENVSAYLDRSLAYAEVWMKARHRTLNYRIIHHDFLLSASRQTNPVHFDAVISNPPYFKITRNDLRAQLYSDVVHGQPNIYALFMTASSALLKPHGLGVFITPRSFAAGQYFSRFRQHFFSQLTPRAIHVFESRQDIFSEVLQENIILAVERSSRRCDVVISSSQGDDFNHISLRKVPFSKIFNDQFVLHLPLSDSDDIAMDIVSSWPNTLRDLGLDVSTGPIVAFRNERYITTSGDVPSTHYPLLWMQNIQPMRCEWPIKHPRQYLAQGNYPQKLLLQNQNYVLIRRFSAKEEVRRLVVAPYLANLDTPFIGLENHLNYIYRPDGNLSDDEARGVAMLLNSSLVDTYFRTFSGNTQVNATELRNMPLPSLETIIELGRSGAMPADADHITHVIPDYA